MIISVFGCLCVLGRTTTFMTARPHRDTAKIDYHLFHRQERTSGSEILVGNMSDGELQEQPRRQLEEDGQLQKRPGKWLSIAIKQIATGEEEMRICNC